jgi:hypothetical protein
MAILWVEVRSAASRTSWQLYMGPATRCILEISMEVGEVRMAMGMAMGMAIRMAVQGKEKDDGTGDGGSRVFIMEPGVACWRDLCRSIPASFLPSFLPSFSSPLCH